MREDHDLENQEELEEFFIVMNRRKEKNCDDARSLYSSTERAKLWQPDSSCYDYLSKTY